MYYLNSRYYDPAVRRFISADKYIFTGGIVGCNMFVYCYNNPVRFIDLDGYEPDDIVDSDGDGVVDYYVYEYTYSDICFYIYGNGVKYGVVEKTGYVYIFVGKPRTFFEDPSNWPANFNSSVDLMVGDYTSGDNPNMYAYQAQLIGGSKEEVIAECLQQYDADFDTPWERTTKSLIIEWEAHKFYAPFGESAQNVDFDNLEEGKGFIYFTGKAIKRGWNKYVVSLFS